MDAPLISVIIPVYNVERYLRQCLDSVTGQTYRNLEIILIDDGSADSSGRICDEYARADQRITVIHQKNQGLSAARNAGLDICTGAVVAFVDSDDWLESDAYRKMAGLMLEKDLDMVFCTANVIEDGEVLETRFSFYEGGCILDPGAALRESLTDRIGSQAWLRIYRRSCVEGLRFPLGRIYEDIAVSHIPFIKAERPIGFLDEPLYNYRLNHNGISLTPVPHKAYHIFLGFVEHCRCAAEYAPDVLEECVAKTARHALSVCNAAIRYPQADLSRSVREAEAFLAEHYGLLMKSREVELKWKAAVYLRRHCKKLYDAVFGAVKLVRHE